MIVYIYIFIRRNQNALATSKIHRRYKYATGVDRRRRRRHDDDAIVGTVAASLPVRRVGGGEILIRTAGPPAASSFAGRRRRYEQTLHRSRGGDSAPFDRPAVFSICFPRSVRPLPVQVVTRCSSRAVVVLFCKHTLGTRMWFS